MLRTIVLLFRNSIRGQFWARVLRTYYEDFNENRYGPVDFMNDTNLVQWDFSWEKKCAFALSANCSSPPKRGSNVLNTSTNTTQEKRLMAEPGDLLAEAIGHSPPVGRVVLIGDCVEISGAFLLHLLLKRCLSLDSSSVVFIALSHPFSHYDRILRKMGCNLSVQRKNEKLHFLGLQDFSAGCKGNSIDNGFCKLYNEIQKAVEAARSKEIKAGCVFIMIDDLSLLEIAGDGSDNDVLDFVHYCATFTSKMDCSLIILNHDDVYSSEEAPGLLTHLQHISDIEIKAAPLNTGLAADVHGQLTVVNKGLFSDVRRSARKIWNFQFKVKETSVDFFYPGTQL